MLIRVTNLNPVDVLVDINGKGNVEDKTFVHPRTTVELLIAATELPTIKAIPGVRVIVMSKTTTTTPNTGKPIPPIPARTTSTAAKAVAPKVLVGSGASISVKTK
jgi:hypothetical protein